MSEFKFSHHPSHINSEHSRKEKKSCIIFRTKLSCRLENVSSKILRHINHGQELVMRIIWCVINMSVRRPLCLFLWGCGETLKKNYLYFWLFSNGIVLCNQEITFQEVMGELKLLGKNIFMTSWLLQVSFRSFGVPQWTLLFPAVGISSVPCDMKSVTHVYLPYDIIDMYTGVNHQN